MHANVRDEVMVVVAWLCAAARTPWVKSDTGWAMGKSLNALDLQKESVPISPFVWS